MWGNLLILHLEELGLGERNIHARHSIEDFQMNRLPWSQLGAIGVWFGLVSVFALGNVNKRFGLKGENLSKYPVH